MFAAECMLDLNFVVDSSWSINYKDAGNWNKVRRFVENIVTELEIGPNNVQVACVLFSREARVQWGLTTHRDKSSLITDIRTLPYLNAITNLNDALYRTWKTVFAQGNGTRPGALKVTIILTDGEDNVPEQGTPLTLQNATACKNQSIRLMVVAVSDAVNQARLRQIVSDQSQSSRNYYHVDDFNALNDIVSELTQQICATTPAPGPSIKLFPLFILFIHALNTFAASA